MKRNSSPGFYDGKNDVTCGKTGEATIEAALSREMWQNRAKEKEREKEGGGGERERRMEASRIYEGFTFPLKNNVSHNLASATFNRAPKHPLYFSGRDTPTRSPSSHQPKVIIQRKTYHALAANMEPASGT